MSLGAQSIHATREGPHLEDGAAALGVLLSGSEGTTHGTSQLGTEVKRDVLLALVELAKLLRLLLVHHCQNASNVLASHTDLGELSCSTTSDLCNTKSSKLSLQLLKLIEKLLLRLLTEFVGLNLRCL